MPHHLNIVAFDVPWPADYGGVIDVYHKIRWLHAAGVKIHLHCFTYRRKPSKELEALCVEVHYYRRRTGVLRNLSLLPYTVHSRRSAKLKCNLLRNDYPVLFEVLHTCYLMNDPDFVQRIKVYRHSNIEHVYYAQIARSERGLIRKLFHYIEAWRLQRFERIVRYANLILAVNEKDTAYFREKYPSVRSVYLPSFHANEQLLVKKGQGDFILVHGNLSVAENYEAALWLLRNVVAGISHKVIFAGLNPPAFLAEEIKVHSNAELEANPDQERMNWLISNAQLHLLYTSQPTGLKLKLLNVLFAGRFVICNRNMLEGTGITANSGLYIAANGPQFRQCVNKFMYEEFGEAQINDRSSMLHRFSNERNGRRLIAEIFENRG